MFSRRNFSPFSFFLFGALVQPLGFASLLCMGHGPAWVAWPGMGRMARHGSHGPHGALGVQVLKLEVSKTLRLLLSLSVQASKPDSLTQAGSPGQGLTGPP